MISIVKGKTEIFLCHQLSVLLAYKQTLWLCCAVLSRSYGFEQRVILFLKQHPYLREKFATILGDLERDSFNRIFDTITLVANSRVCRRKASPPVTAFTLSLVIEDHEINLLDVGGHDEVLERQQLPLS
jgi:hypothetical protein